MFFMFGQQVGDRIIENMEVLSAELFLLWLKKVAMPDIVHLF